MSNQSTDEKIPPDVDFLLKAQTIRERCQLIRKLTEKGLGHFHIDESKWEPTLDLVLQVTQENYPNGHIPYHSRWNHFLAQDPQRLNQLLSPLQEKSMDERTRTLLDLAIVSVFLDAGAGDEWRYREPNSGTVLGRSEALAVASFHMFLQGAFSSQPQKPWQVDGEGLLQLTKEKLISFMQVGPQNPLVGVDGRLQLLHDLGKNLLQRKTFFGSTARPSGLIDKLPGKTFLAQDLLYTVLLAFNPIWPSRLTLQGFNLGDVWEHPLLKAPGPRPNLVPFHKLSQWLTYSLIGPLEEAGYTINNLDGLTGLPEYRNGGLFVDMGLLQVKDPLDKSRLHQVNSPFIVEWRALTVCLLDELAQRARFKLNKTPEQFPLPKILEGGTWSAGRMLAKKLRPSGGGGPFQISSDGTVF